MTDIIPGFIQKTYDIFMSDEYRNSCCWSRDGNSIIIKDQSHFTKYVLPKYFKHNNFQSFVRQLNMYDFHKVIQDPHNGEFKHPLFQRGRIDLLMNIKRKVHLKTENKKRKFQTLSDDSESTNSDDTEEKNQQIVLYQSKLKPNYTSIHNKMKNIESLCQRLELENVELRNIINDSKHKQQLFFNQMENILNVLYKACNDTNNPILDSLAKTFMDQRKQLQINEFPITNDNIVLDDDRLWIQPDPQPNNTLVRGNSLSESLTFSRISSLEDWCILCD